MQLDTIIYLLETKLGQVGLRGFLIGFFFIIISVCFGVPAKYLVDTLPVMVILYTALVLAVIELPAPK